MELNWTTFALEVFNFLVLVWLLKRFLYKPVRDTIERRRQVIEDELADARRRQTEAAALLADRQQQLALWEVEQQAARGELQTALEDERARRLAELDDDMQREVERRNALIEHQQRESWRALEGRAMELSCRFATRLLSRFRGAELERQIIAAALEDLQQLVAPQRDQLRQSLVGGKTIAVSSVYPIPEDQRAQLLATLESIGGAAVPDIQYDLDPALICGCRLAVEAMQINANLAGELQFFRGEQHLV